MLEEDDFRIDHIGWQLWRAAGSWKSRFADGMTAAGHAWYAEAKSSVLPHIGPDGTRQSQIVQAMGLSKQAVQQLIDDLVREEIVERIPDPEDGRGKVIQFTEKGRAAMQDARQVKRRVEDELRQSLGDEDFNHLKSLLSRVSFKP